jgi:hypothetical protein
MVVIRRLNIAAPLEVIREFKRIFLLLLLLFYCMLILVCNSQDEMGRASACTVLVGNPEGKRPVGRPRRGPEDNRVGIWTGFVWPRPVAGCCEHGNEPSGSIECCDVLEQLSNCHSQEGLSSLGIISNLGHISPKGRTIRE